jgi:hypothetical protein
MNVNFNPPYWLAGSGLVSWAFKKTLSLEFKEQLKRENLTPVKVFGHYFCLVIASHYTDVPAHPDPYQEVILSVLALKNLKIYAVPWALYLDSEFHVELGRKYYSLPKHLDKSMCVRFSENLFFCEGKNFTIKGELPGTLSRLLCLPLSCTVSTLVKLATRLFPVVGMIDGQESKVAQIPLTPRTCKSTPVFGAILELGNEQDRETLCVVWTQVWNTLIGSVEVPKNF